MSPGNARPIAATAERSPAIPGVPRLAEQGVRGADVQTWYRLFATPGTHRAGFERCEKLVRDATIKEDGS